MASVSRGTQNIIMTSFVSCPWSPTDCPPKQKGLTFSLWISEDLIGFRQTVQQLWKTHTHTYTHSLSLWAHANKTNPRSLVFTHTHTYKQTHIQYIGTYKRVFHISTCKQSHPHSCRLTHTRTTYMNTHMRAHTHTNRQGTWGNQMKLSDTTL